MPSFFNRNLNELRIAGEEYKIIHKFENSNIVRICELKIRLFNCFYYLILFLLFVWMPISTILSTYYGNIILFI